MIKRGAKGDATLLKPTVIACVPLVLERIYKGKFLHIMRKIKLMVCFVSYGYFLYAVFSQELF